ncbi:MAG: hypothetical protein U9Q67_04920 [Patescibacteria group bacterium]|nr:hypothetical protein [Patescibacteria group bacterium]
MLWLLEIKNCWQRDVQGFDVYINMAKSGGNRDRVMFLIKSCWSEYVEQVDMDTEDQIWVKLSLWPELRLGGVYIPPEDSPYYDRSLLGALEGRVRDGKSVLVLGDFNARVGNPELLVEDSEMLQYENVKDLTVNSRGRSIMSMCQGNGMLVANHLKIKENCLGGNLSFRKRNWISEIDLCLVKNNLINKVKSLDILQGVRGSEHAPLTVVVDHIGTIPAEILKK